MKMTLITHEDFMMACGNHINVYHATNEDKLAIELLNVIMEREPQTGQELQIIAACTFLRIQEIITALMAANVVYATPTIDGDRAILDEWRNPPIVGVGISDSAVLMRTRFTVHQNFKEGVIKWIIKGIHRTNSPLPHVGSSLPEAELDFSSGYWEGKTGNLIGVLMGSLSQFRPISNLNSLRVKLLQFVAYRFSPTPMGLDLFLEQADAFLGHAVSKMTIVHAVAGLINLGYLNLVSNEKSDDMVQLGDDVHRAMAARGYRSTEERYRTIHQFTSPLDYGTGSYIDYIPLVSKFLSGEVLDDTCVVLRRLFGGETMEYLAFTDCESTSFVTMYNNHLDAMVEMNLLTKFVPVGRALGRYVKLSEDFQSLVQRYHK